LGFGKWLCGFAAATGAECDHLVMGRCEVAQALELVRALRHQLREMTAQLAWVERQDVTGSNGRACAMRMQAAALRRDIHKAQFLIDQLQRRYLDSDERGATVDRQAAMASSSRPRSNSNSIRWTR
jgi:hypothetical protein